MKIIIDDIEFGYTSSPVLKDIKFDLGGAQLVSILGPNGVGKSTLIHCINNILTPSSGVVTVNGKDVTSYKLKDLAKIMGYVPYTSSDRFPLSVVDTVLMGRHPHSSWKSTDKDLDVVYDTLEMLNIEDLAMRSFSELSAGQHQKVMLARGFAQEPKILLLDEPTSNLDIKHQMEVTMILKEMSVKKGILVIMISHDINMAARFSDKVILMSEGSIFSIGTPAEVINEENIRSVYGVDSRIIDDRGTPHVIIQNPVKEHRNESVKKTSKNSVFKAQLDKGTLVTGL